MEKPQEELQEYFNNKNIIIIGPSATVKDDCKSIVVDDYDIICRLNNHWKYKIGDHKYIGHRTDVLYHCLNPDQYSSDDLKFLKQKGIKLILRNELKYNQWKADIFNKRNRHIGIDYYCTPNKLFKQLENKLGCNPSTGVLLIEYLLSFEIGLLTVVGFDFYQTLYLDKKDDYFLNKIQNNKVANHNPKIQLHYVKQLYNNENKFKAVGKLKIIIES